MAATVNARTTEGIDHRDYHYFEGSNCPEAAVAVVTVPMHDASRSHGPRDVRVRVPRDRMDPRP